MYRTTEGPVDNANPQEGPTGAPPVGNCSEPHATQAAREEVALNPDNTPTGYQTVWAGRNQQNGYPNGDPPRTTGMANEGVLRQEMQPCPTFRGNQHNHL